MRNRLSPQKKIIKIQSVNTKNHKNPIPELRLRGRWLTSNGFYETEYVEISYGFEYIVIYPYKEIL